jgi:chemotaxis protein methyltransferase CheR
MTKINAERRLYSESFIEEIKSQDFHYLRSALFSRTGITLSDSKKELLQSRLRSRVQALGLGGFSDYRSLLQRLSPDHAEWQEFTNSLTTNKTDWFREPSHFDFLVNEFIPKWQQLTRKPQLSVWSGPCSTGEEPYTIAMILDQVCKVQALRSYKILATDIDTDVLKTAAKGIYSKSALKCIPSNYHKPAFIPGTEGIGHLMKVRPELKNRIKFQQHNLTQKPYPWVDEFDVIFCRNVFIYFSKDVIAEVLDSFYRSAAPNAILFIGHSESLQGASQWRYVGPSIYVKGKVL